MPEPTPSPQSSSPLCEGKASTSLDASPLIASGDCLTTEPAGFFIADIAVHDELYCILFSARDKVQVVLLMELLPWMAHAEWTLQEHKRIEQTMTIPIGFWHLPRAHPLPRSTAMSTHELAVSTLDLATGLSTRYPIRHFSCEIYGAIEKVRTDGWVVSPTFVNFCAGSVRGRDASSVAD